MRESKINKIGKVSGEYAAITIGAIIAALSVVLFFIPFNIAPGGVSGLATIVHYTSGGILPVGVIMLILNVPLFVAGRRNMGGFFMIRTVYATIVMSAAADILEEPITGHVLPLLASDGREDILLYAVMGGLLMGAGLGLVLKTETTTGGGDLLAAMLNKRFSWISVGQFLLIIDILVVGAAIVVFGSLLTGLYSLIAIFVSSKVVDFVIEGLNYNKVFYIFSLKFKEIAEGISGEELGVTLIHAYGVYGKRERDVVMCVVNKNRVQRIKTVIRNIDPTAFVMILNSKEVHGEGFGVL